LAAILLISTYKLIPFRKPTVTLDQTGIFGPLTFAITLITFVIDTSLDANKYPWSHPVVIILYSVSLVFLAAFVLIELRLKVSFIPIRELASAGVVPIEGAAFCAGIFATGVFFLDCSKKMYADTL